MRGLPSRFPYCHSVVRPGDTWGRGHALLLLEQEAGRVHTPRDSGNLGTPPEAEELERARVM